MSVKRAIRIATMLILVMSIVISSAGCGAGPAPTLTPTPQKPTLTPLPTQTASPTPLPSAQADAGIDLDRLSPTGPFVVKFSEPMDPRSSSIPLQSFPGSEGKGIWSDGNSTLTFQPAVPWNMGETYTFFLDPALRTARGSSLGEAPQWTAWIDAGPAVISQNPPAGQINQRKPVIQVSFDRPMNRARTGQALSIQPSVPFQTSWVDDTRLQIELTQPLEPGKRYDFLLTGAGAEQEVTANEGLVMQQDYLWSYSLPPLEVKVSAGGESRVDIGFNYPLDTQKTGLPFQIYPHLDGTWAWDSTTGAHLDTTEPIGLGVQYFLGLSGPLRDADGILEADKKQYAFTAPPPLSVTYSSENDQDVTALPYVAVQFDLAVDHLSAQNAFSISPYVPGGFTWTQDAGKEVMKFLPQRLLDGNKTYTVTIAPSVKSSKGQRILYPPFVADFETGYTDYYYYSRMATFGYGDDAQVVDAKGPRKVQFGAGADPENVRFDLYAYSMNDFARLYANKHGERQDWPESDFLPVPGEGEKPAASWPYVPGGSSGNNDQPVDETVIPSEVPAGLYVLNIVYKNRVFDQLFLILTGNALMLKRSGDKLFIWVSNINGKSVAGAEIRLYSSVGSAIEEGNTDENGLFHINLPKDFTPMYVAARVPNAGGDDVTIAGLDYQWYDYTYTDYSNHKGYSSSTGTYLTYIYTDRPIYRPGQTVNFKVIARLNHDVSYELLPAGTPVTVNILDARANLVETEPFKTDEFGSVNGSFQLVEGTMLGNYSVQAVVGGESFKQSFKVQDYRKPDFQITLAPAEAGQTNQMVVGDQLTLDLHAGYYFGEPVANKSISAQVYYQPYYYYDGGWSTSDGILLDSDAQTDGQGNARITISPKRIPDYEGYRSWYSSAFTATYTLQATIDDGSHQTVTGTYVFTVHDANLEISVDNGGYFHRPGKTFTVLAKAVDLSAHPFSGQALDLTVLRWSRDKRDFVAIGSSYQLETDASGQAIQDLALEAGAYELQLDGKDSRGNTTTDTTWVYVFSSSDDWVDRYQQPVTILADQDSYSAYETARFTIYSTFSGPALLTFERGSVISSQPIELTAPLTSVEVPVSASYAPNVYVTVNAWQPRQEAAEENNRYTYWASNHPDSYLRLASTEIRVDAGFQALNVKIGTDQATYSPGQAVTVDIDVSDAQGKPVRAEVSLALVDEAIFALSEDLAPNIFTAFYGPRYQGTTTYDSMSPYREIIVEGRGGGGGGGALPGPGLRSEFLDTAAWFPVLKTDGSGRAAVTFNLPDNLTTWRLTAKAVTLNSKVGEGTTSILTNKELIVRPSLPRVLTSGDRADLTAFIHNNGAETLGVDVSLQAPGLEVQNGTTQTVIVDPGTAVPVTWSVLVQAVSDTQVTIRAATNEGLSDAVSLPLPIQPAAAMDVQTQSGDFSGNLLLSLSVPDIEPQTSRVTLQLSSAQASTILTGLEYLTGYPYGCIEQTMSRALPNAVVSRAGKTLGIGGADMKARVDPLVQASIQKLYGMQHANGGWGWWYDDASNDYQTAWVMFGLALIKDAGYEIDPGVIDNGAEYLTQNLDKMDIRTRAYALYSLALNGKGDLGDMRALVNTSLNELDPFSQAALALALRRGGDAAGARAVLDSLGQYATIANGRVYWRQSSTDGTYHQKTMSSTLRTTALVLDAYVAIEPNSNLIPGMVTYLLSQRQGQNGWGTTNETSFTILALTDFLIHQQQLTGQVSFQVSLNGHLLQGSSLTPQDSTAAIDIPVEKLLAGKNTLTVAGDANVKIYYDLTARYNVLLDEKTLPRGTIAITRSYADAASGQLLNTFHAGQLVEVELTVSVPNGGYFMLVEDHLPGGLEALNERLNTTELDLMLDGTEEWMPGSFLWEDYGYNFKEVFGDRVTFFITDFSRGYETFTYMARATTGGEFLALPAEASAMYDPATWGRSASDRVIVQSP